MKLRSALLAAGLLALPAAAIAQPISGPYVSLGVGANIFQDQTVKYLTAPNFGVTFNNPGSIKYDVYLGGQGSVGWGFGNGFRAEISGVFQRSSVTHLAGYSGAGYTDETDEFANVLYDFDLSPFGVPGLAPYVGAGVGYAEEHFDGPHATSPAGNYLELGGTKGSFGVDGIVGLAYNIPDYPGLALTAEYRFTAIPGNPTLGGVLNVPGVGASYTREKVEGLYGHLGMIGLRYALWQPAPPAPPAPPSTQAPPPPVVESRTYLVFFDWDRADLTARARQIVAEAAQASTHVATTRIEVNGYTDLSGTVAYNDRLSVRRAKSVEAELIRDGVPAGEIAIHGYGESNPLVPTAPGVREPQNRRVEIILK
jgi:outer membrane protein OmpA-like peptidoglycan-associated protein